MHVVRALRSNFNSRPSARGDAGAWRLLGVLESHFNSRPSARGDSAEPIIKVCDSDFNSRPSARGDSAGGFRRYRDDYFNSRPSARGDVHYGFIEQFICISIHAPPRGATAVQHGGADARHFNSRPSARGDGSRILSRRPVGYFNSRPSARGDVPPRNAPHRRHFNSRPSARGDLYAEGADPNEDISIHAPPRGATQARPPRSRRRRYFNSRPSARGDSMDSHMRGEFPFQFTPLREGRRCPRSCCATACLFQFTPLREGRRVDVRIEGEAVLFQFTPLREGRPGHDLVDERALAHISIHAPPRGATAGKNGELPHRRQFQFTPLREGRREKVSLTIFYPLFQFTPLREGRLEGGGKKWWDALLISIHAPPRGATGRVRAGRRTDPYFNSRPSARGDRHRRSPLACKSLFQFTPLREGRQASGARIVHNKKNFNSRPSARGDPTVFCIQGNCIISIHAPPRGATYEANRSRLF